MKYSQVSENVGIDRDNPDGYRLWAELRTFEHKEKLRGIVHLMLISRYYEGSDNDPDRIVVDETELKSLIVKLEKLLKEFQEHKKRCSKIFNLSYSKDEDAQNRCDF